MASTSRLPWPHSRTPVRIVPFSLIADHRWSWISPALTDSRVRRHGRAMPIGAGFDPEIQVLLLAVGARALDWLIGDPAWLWGRRLHHPVVLLGALTAWLERRFNRLDLAETVRTAYGALTVLIVIGAAAAARGRLRPAARRPVGWALAPPPRHPPIAPRAPFPPGPPGGPRLAPAGP